MPYMLQDTISAAAQQLDNIRPGWANKITKKINMEDGTCCILGQLYGKYSLGIGELFGVDVEDRAYYNSVFAHKADSAEWQKEVDLRQKQESTGWKPETEEWTLQSTAQPTKPSIVWLAQVRLNLRNGTILVDADEINGILEALNQYKQPE